MFSAVHRLKNIYKYIEDIEFIIDNKDLKITRVLKISLLNPLYE